MQVSLDLPRDQLLGWIGKQLGGGFRAVVAEEGEGDILGQIEKFELIASRKKDIVKTSKLVSDKFNVAISEEWRAAELKHMLMKSEARLEKLKFQKRCLEQNKWVDMGKLRGVRIVQLTGEFCPESSIASGKELAVEIHNVWGNVYEKFTKELSHRAKEEEAMKNSFSEISDKSVTNRRNLVLEDYLHERFLLKKLKEKRKEMEEYLRDRISVLSSELHAIRDLGRIKQEAEAEKHSEMNRHIEASERMLEWQLMEEQILIERQLAEIDEKFDSKIKRYQAELVRLRKIGKIEADFVKEKDFVIDIFKSEISLIRRDVRDIESAISQFRSALRKEDKLRREHSKILRE